MKITVLYGNYTTAARNRYLVIVDALKKRGWEIVSVEADKRSISEKLTTNSLFGGEQLFTIENANQLDAATLKWLADYSPQVQGNILIYHEGEIPKKALDILKKNAKLERFDLPKTIFVFLDSITPHNASTSIKLLHKVVENEPVELVFSLIASLFRDLYWVKADPKSLKLPSWRAQKLSRQASKFSVEQIKKIINQLAEIDIKVKTSQAELLPSLDLLLASELQ